MRGTPKLAQRRFRSTVWLATLLVLLALVAACAPSPEVSTLALSLHQLPSCALGSASGLSLQALGDFPSQSERLDPALGTLSLDSFPLQTRELKIEASFAHGTGKPTASGRVSLLPPLMPRSVLLLPQSTACVLGDPLAVAPAGSVAAALADGGVLIAGGLGSDSIALSSVLLLPAGAQLVQQVPDGMLLRRAYATATSVGELVVIAGGGADKSGSAQETYEIFDAISGKFSATLSKKLLTGPRMQHAAARLPDGRLLLVGGRAAPDGPLLHSAELLDPVTAERIAIMGNAGLVDGRLSPQLLVLDSGEVLVAGGYDTAGKSVTSVERFDPRTRSFRRLSLRLTAHSEALASELPGGRFAWLGCDTGKAAGCSLSLQLSTTQDFISVPVAIDFAGHTPAGLTELRMLTLADGRLFVTGSDPSATIAHRAFVIDPSTATISPRDAVRVPSSVLRTGDGTLLELDAFGASLRREDTASAYDSPSTNLLASGSPWVALDAPAHWQRDTTGLHALVVGSRLDLAALRFADLRVELDGQGSFTLGWSAEPGAGASDTHVSVSAGTLRAEGCNVALPKGATLVASRHGRSLQLSSSTGAALCSTSLPAGALRLWLSAEPGAQLRRLTATRL